MSDSDLAYAPPRAIADVFGGTDYLVKRPFWSWLGRRFMVFDASGRLVMYVRHPILRLKQEFTIFTDESESKAIAHVKARQMIAINFAYDVTDAATGELLGTLRSRGLKSILRDTWDILDASGAEAGLVEEEGSSILRRFLPILTGKWRIDFRGATAGRIRQIFRFFVKEYAVSLPSEGRKMDPRFAIACALLALMAETRRENSN